LIGEIFFRAHGTILNFDGSLPIRRLADFRTRDARSPKRFCRVANYDASWNNEPGAGSKERRAESGEEQKWSSGVVE
jgi:hypothetical protein